MTKTNYFDASIALEINISNIRSRETVSFTFTDNENNFVGDFEMNLFDSDRKNTSKTLENALTIDGANMLIVINPTQQQISVGTHYYEIFNSTSKRVEFFGTLKIKK